MSYLLSNNKESLDDHRATDYVIHVPSENIGLNELQKVVLFENSNGVAAVCFISPSVFAILSCLWPKV